MNFRTTPLEVDLIHQLVDQEDSPAVFGENVLPNRWIGNRSRVEPKEFYAKAQSRQARKESKKVVIFYPSGLFYIDLDDPVMVSD